MKISFARGFTSVSAARGARNGIGVKPERVSAKPKTLHFTQSTRTRQQ